VTARETFRTIVEVGIMPVVRAASAEAAIQAVEAGLIGGVRVAEITMTAPGADFIGSHAKHWRGRL
jgi:2-dehydro-3-deoxyphosphogluconate aldolase/(4S)-4-hydroxy-2-oxoglutarate aldolase